jgi:hypothetical protein
VYIDDGELEYTRIKLRLLWLPRYFQHWLRMMFGLSKFDFVHALQNARILCVHCLRKISFATIATSTMRFERTCGMLVWSSKLPRLELLIIAAQSTFPLETALDSASSFTFIQSFRPLRYL